MKWGGKRAELLIMENAPDHVSSSSPQSASGPITDSPWFWVLLFAAMGLVMLSVMAPKYAQRQTQIEQQYQGREWARQKALSPKREPGVTFSTPGHTVIPLWPLRAIAAAVLVIAAVALVMRKRARERHKFYDGAHNGRGEAP